MESILLSGALLVIILAGSIGLIFFKRYRKAGLALLGLLLVILTLVGFYVYTPRAYDRRYLQTYVQAPPVFLREVADSLPFYIGSIPGPLPIFDPRFARNFNSLTPENALKMGSLLKNQTPGDYDFSQADTLVNQALQQGMRVRGHTLVWGKLSYMFKAPDLDTYLEKYPEHDRSKRLWQMMEKHITTVLKHYKGRIHTWDVVNEPMSIFRAGALENNVYYQHLGEAYIDRSFRLAHSVDPSLKLCLNENFSDYQGKMAQSFLSLLKRLKKRKVPIHGVGIQSHILYKTDTAVASLQQFIQRITELGLEVEITELDARLKLFEGADDPYQAQGEYYGRILKVLLQNPLCKGVTFWGLSDEGCWMDAVPFLFPKPNEPYLYDQKMNPKPAFYQVYHTLKAQYDKGNKVTMR